VKSNRKKFKDRLRTLIDKSILDGNPPYEVALALISFLQEGITNQVTVDKIKERKGEKLKNNDWKQKIKSLKSASQKRRSRQISVSTLS
jgi:hypothetical protein